MLKLKLLIAGVAFGTGTLAFAQNYFDFGQIPGVAAEPAVQIDLNPMLLGLAGAAARADNPAAADLISSVDGVRVRVYKNLEDVDDVVDFIDTISARLERDAWQRVVSVQDEGQVRIYIRGDEETVTGVTAMLVNDEGAVFVNIAGSINAQQLAQSLANMNTGKALASLGNLNAAGVGGAGNASR